MSKTFLVLFTFDLKQSSPEMYRDAECFLRKIKLLREYPIESIKKQE